MDGQACGPRQGGDLPELSTRSRPPSNVCVARECVERRMPLCLVSVPREMAVAHRNVGRGAEGARGDRRSEAALGRGGEAAEGARGRPRAAALAISRTIQRRSRPNALTLRAHGPTVGRPRGLPADAPPPVRVEVEGPSRTRCVARRRQDPRPVARRAQGTRQWQGVAAGEGAGVAEGACVDLLSVAPEYVEMYEDEDETGRTVRRYAIASHHRRRPILAMVAMTTTTMASPPPPRRRRPKRTSTHALQRRARRRVGEGIKLKAEAEADRLWREERRKVRGDATWGAPAPLEKGEGEAGRDEGERPREAVAKSWRQA